MPRGPPCPTRSMPVAADRIVASSLAAGQLAGDAALVQDDDPIGHADQLGELGRDHQDGGAPAGSGSTHHLVDGPRGADVDAAGGLVEEITDDRSVTSHLARTTFCWLPPDRKRTSGRARGGELTRRGRRGSSRRTSPVRRANTGG